MASTSETGHAKNVANLDALLAAIASYGANYNPSREALTQASLQTLSTSAKESLATLNSLIPAYSSAVAERENAFVPLSKLVTRISNAIKSSETSTQIDDNVTTIVRKLQGRRATAKLSEEEKAQKTAEGTAVNQVSVAQLSFDSKVENLDKLIKLLENIPQYSPNETELQVATLNNLLSSLRAKNNAVLAAQAPVNNARIARNEVLYKPITGLVDIAFDTKTYIKSLYGTGSPQYKQIAKLTFKANKQN